MLDEFLSDHRPERVVDSRGGLVRLHVNGSTRNVFLEPWVTLLDALRERLGLVGTRKGCNHGQCGACTVLVDGRRVLSCLSLACAHEGEEITTIEGIGQDGELHPLQAAFVRHDGFQCGYCTSGQIMSALGMILAGGVTTDDDIRERMSGNLCRCGAYVNIVAAIREVLNGDAPAVADDGPRRLPSDLRPDLAEERS